MRYHRRVRTLAIIALVAACGAPPAPAKPPIGCFPAATAELPLVVLYELDPALGTRFPTVAIWEDGEILYRAAGRDTAPARTGKIAAARAIELARQVRGDLAGVPDHVAIARELHAPLARIIARDGNDWRIVAVYGFTSSASEPAGFAAAMRRTLAAWPGGGAAWVPHRLQVAYDEHLEDGEDLDPVPWPPELPAPSGDRGKLVVDPRLATVLAPLEGRTLTRDGAAWEITIHELFRGEDAIEDMQRCLFRRQRSTTTGQ
jgi:hypothetical protein